MKKLLLPLFTLVLATQSYAVRVISLYSAELPVPTQTSDYREQAIHQGFQQVLVKVSGDPNIDKNPVIKQAIRRAEYYVQEYSYASDTQDSSQYMIKILYNKNDVNRLLHKTGIAYWGESRPLIFVWLTETNNNHNTDIVGSDIPTLTFSLTKQAADKFGLPLIFPMMDVGEVQTVSPDDVTNLKMPVLQATAERYSPDGMLIGNITHHDNKYDSTWKLVMGAQEWNWQISEMSNDDVINELMARLNDTMKDRYMIKDANAQSALLKLRVSDVLRRQDLSELMAYLEGLGPVRQVELKEVAGNDVEFAIAIQGSIDNFKKNALIGQHLMFKAENTIENKLFYGWKQ